MDKGLRLTAFLHPSEMWMKEEFENYQGIRVVEIKPVPKIKMGG